MDPSHPIHRFPDTLIEKSIRKAIAKCNKRVSVMDCLLEVTNGASTYDIKYNNFLTRRERQYLSSKIGKMLNERYTRESEKVWLIKEECEA
jgi:hypothetical protein